MKIIAKAAFILLVLTWLIPQCSSKQKSTDPGGEDYQVFAARFDKDTVFQKARVRFEFTHRVNLSTSQVDRKQFKIETFLGDSVIVKTTYLKDTTYWIKFTFRKEEGKWYLMNYLDSYDD